MADDRNEKRPGSGGKSGNGRREGSNVRSKAGSTSPAAGKAGGSAGGSTGPSGGSGQSGGKKGGGSGISAQDVKDIKNLDVKGDVKDMVKNRGDLNALSENQTARKGLDIAAKKSGNPYAVAANEGLKANDELKAHGGGYDLNNLAKQPGPSQTATLAKENMNNVKAAGSIAKDKLSGEGVKEKLKGHGRGKGDDGDSGGGPGGGGPGDDDGGGTNGDDADAGEAGAGGPNSDGSDKSAKDAGDKKDKKDKSGDDDDEKKGKKKKDKKGPIAKIKERIRKIMHMIAMAIKMLKTFLVTQLLLLLMKLLAMLMAIVQAVINGILAVVMAVVNAVAAVVAVVAAVGAVVAGGILFGLFCLVVIVVVVVVAVNNNAAQKDGVVDCYNDISYMETDIPPGYNEQSYLNAKLIYNVMKLVYSDMTVADVNIAGIIGNWDHESGIDPTAVETIYSEPFGIGEAKLRAMQGECDVWHNYNHVVTYVEVEVEVPSGPDPVGGGGLPDPDSTPHIVDAGPTTTTVLEPVVSHVYASTSVKHQTGLVSTVGKTITYNGSNYTTNAESRYNVDADGNSIAVPYYCSECDTYWINGVETTQQSYHVDNIDFQMKYINPTYSARYQGIKYAGIGLGQWTNSRNRDLLAYAEAHNANWYDLSTQLMFMLTGDDVSRRNWLLGWEEKVFVSDATADFLQYWEGGGTSNLAERQAKADKWYEAMADWNEGVDYSSEAGLGLLAVATGSLSAVSDAAAVSQTRACSGVGFFDNSSAYMAALSYAWGPGESDANKGTPCWQHIFTSLAPGDPYFQSCDRTVAIAVWWSGTDWQFPLGACSTIATYLMQQDYLFEINGSSKWIEVDVEYNDSTEEFIKQLRPGDVLIRSDGVTNSLSEGVGHVIMYVGEEAAMRRFGEDAAGYTIVSGSINTRSPSVGKFTTSADFPAGARPASACYETYRVFRSVQKSNTDGSGNQVRNTGLTCAARN